MASAYLGQIMLFAGPFAPKGWHFCDGSAQSIRSNTALFSLLGTQYGGDGVNTFNLPDLRSRVAVGAGAGPGLTSWSNGQQGGTENVTLTTNQLPSHNHNLVGSTVAASASAPGGNFLANANDGNGINVYAASQTAANMGTGSIGQTGGGQGHTNIQPSLGMNYCICMQGVYPSRN